MTDLQKLVEVIRDEFGSSIEFRVGLKLWSETAAPSYNNYSEDIDFFFNNSSVFFGWANFIGYDLMINLPYVIGFDPDYTYKVTGFRSFEVKTQLKQIEEELSIVHEKLEFCLEKSKHLIKERERNLILED